MAALVALRLEPVVSEPSANAPQTSVPTEFTSAVIPAWSSDTAIDIPEPDVVPTDAPELRVVKAVIPERSELAAQLQSGNGAPVDEASAQASHIPRPFFGAYPIPVALLNGSGAIDLDQTTTLIIDGGDLKPSEFHDIRRRIASGEQIVTVNKELLMNPPPKPGITFR